MTFHQVTLCSSSGTSETRALYEDLHCARGEMENKIKEQQLDLFADRTSTHWMAGYAGLAQ